MVFVKSKSRDDDKTSSHSQDTRKSKSSSSAGPSRVLGPTLPSTVDLVLTREREDEERKAERSYKRKRDKVEDNERIEEMVGPREVGQAGQLEKKRAKREGDGAFRKNGSRRYFGGGDTFKDYIRKRDEGSRRLECRICLVDIPFVFQSYMTEKREDNPKNSTTQNLHSFIIVQQEYCFCSSSSSSTVTPLAHLRLLHLVNSSPNSSRAAAMARRRCLGFHVAVGLLASFFVSLDVGVRACEEKPDERISWPWPTDSPALSSAPRTGYYNALDLFKPPALTPSGGLRA
ncbi:hypothetical protein C8J56DRAFT_860057 [Mycena floridula]|nr:hypothetical protein C8J56DRAFT_860057 [Mycena floridula]